MDHESGRTSEAAIVVFEKRPRWTPELQRQFHGENVIVRSCRSVAAIASVSDVPAVAVIVLSLDAAPADVLRFLENRSRRGDGLAIIVVASARWGELEWRIRELGATDFIVEPVAGDDMARMCRRQWQLAASI